jgi:hypothetical protein
MDILGFHDFSTLELAEDAHPILSDKRIRGAGFGF